MRATGIGFHRCAVVAVFGSGVFMAAAIVSAQSPAAAVGPATILSPTAADAPAASARAAETFRSAVALENRGLFDLAAAEWATLFEAHPDDPLANQGRLHHGICLFRLEQYAAASAQFERLQAMGPSLDAKLREQAHANLGLAQFNLGRVTEATERNAAFEAALAAFTAQLDRFPDGPLAPQAVFYRAETWSARGDLAAAIDAYQTFVAQYPDHALAADAHLQLGEALLDQDRPTEAEPHFAKAAAAANFAAADSALEGQADCRLAAKDYTTAAALYAQLVARFPDSELAAPALVAEGKCRYLANELADAITCLHRVHARSDVESADVAEATHWLVKSLLAHGQTAAALVAVDERLNRTSTPPTESLVQLRLDRADVLFEFPKRRGEAADIYAAVARERPTDPLAAHAAYMAAYASLAVGDAKAALAHADLFCTSFPTSDLSADVQTVAAEAELQLGEHAGAERVFARLLRAFPHHEEHDKWLVRRALCLSLADKHREVIDTLQTHWRQIEILELQAEAGLLLGKAHLALDRPADAVRILTTTAALPRWPRTDEVLLTLARAHKTGGDAATATATLGRLIDSEPNSTLLDRAFFDRGECQTSAGDDESATADFAAISDRWPDSPLRPHALLAQGRAEQRQKLLASAQGTLAELLSNYPHHDLAAAALLTRATIRHEMRRYEESLEDVAALLALKPAPDVESDALLVRGMCEAALERLADAAKTFESILDKDAAYRSADRVLYELAWAYDALKQPERSTATFHRLAKEHTASPLAAECWYRVGESQYAAGDFSVAADSFELAEQLADNGQLQEKASHKLAWSHFSAGKFVEAEQAFTEQMAHFAAGPLGGDARVMIAESRFARQDYDGALDAFTAALDETGASRDVRTLGLLHAAQSAGQLDKWSVSIAWLDQCQREVPDSPWSAEIRCERGWALYHQDQWDDAWQEFESVAENNAGPLGARARFMLGEIQFARKQYDNAVRTFFKVAYGYGDKDAPADFHRWQAEAMFEAARCLEQTARRESARRLYHELLARYPESPKAAHARVALQESTTR